MALDHAGKVISLTGGSSFVYRADKETGKQYREYVGGARVEISPHDGHIDEEKLLEDFRCIVLRKMKEDSGYGTKIRYDAESNFHRLNLCDVLVSLPVEKWKTSPQLQKTNYKWWKFWLWPLRLRKEKDIITAQKKMTLMSMDKVMRCLNASGAIWSRPPMPLMPDEQMLEWASKGEE